MNTSTIQVIETEMPTVAPRDPRIARLVLEAKAQRAVYLGNFLSHRLDDLRWVARATRLVAQQCTLARVGLDRLHSA